MLLIIKKFIACSLIIALLSSCAFVPTVSNDLTVGECDVFTKSLDLKMVDVGSDVFLRSLSGCKDAGCVLVPLIIAPGILMSSAIISGSIYAVGNTIHYLEKQARCDDPYISQETIAFSKQMEAVGGKKVKLEILQEADNLEVSDEQD